MPCHMIFCQIDKAAKFKMKTTQIVCTGMHRYIFKEVKHINGRMLPHPSDLYLLLHNGWIWKAHVDFK